MTKVKRCFNCCCIVGLFCASTMAQDAEFYFSEAGNEPGVGGDLTVNVLQGGGTVCVDLYARSLTGAGFLSLGSAVRFDKNAAFSGGGTLSADCDSDQIDYFHAFNCTQWLIRVVDREGGCAANVEMYFIHSGIMPGDDHCLVPDGSGLYIAELCYDYSADAVGTATISDTGVVLLGDEDGNLVATAFRTLTIRVVDCMEDPDCCGPDCNDNTVLDICDIAAGVSEDCNTNGVPDDCDIADGTSQDTFPTRLGGDGVPDECQTVEPTRVGL